MPSFRQVLVAAAVGMVTVTSAAPALPQLDTKVLKAYDMLTRRQNPATGLPDGLGDIDILQFALTLENLETAFYQQGFAKFPDSDFAALGLNQNQIADLKSIGGTEATHVTTLTAAVAGAGTQPVVPCTYKFGFTNAAGMVAVASILENVGVSAYLGAAPLVKNPGILGVAASIVTVESRHQTFIRTAAKSAAIPSPFDTPLGIRNVFTLAAGFIDSCPQGSNLAITPFPSLAMTNPPASGSPVAAAGSMIQVTSTATSATQCAFQNGGLPGGTAFTPFTNGACQVPQGLAGLTYVNLASAADPKGVLTDAITLAGPMLMQVS